MPPGLMIAAPRSGSGKTTLTLGLLRALRRAGVAVASAKCGPDYIDPPFHRAASGRPSVNLDSWAMPPALLEVLAAQVGVGCDLIICEALMGLFDGVPGPAGRTGSSADVAAALGWPVLLVLDASGQSQSAAAVVKGCATYDPRITIAGVVLNRIGSPRHARLATEAIEALGIPVVGTLPRSDAIALPERHLGLVQAGETGELDVRLDRMAAFVAEHTKIDAIRALASPRSLTAPNAIRARSGRPTAGAADRHRPGCGILLSLSPSAARMARRRRRNPLLLAARRRGAGRRLRRLLAARRIPRTARRPGLPDRDSFIDGLRRFAETRPIHGECGGYMVLGTSLTDGDGIVHEMAGLLGVSTSFARRKLHLGYRNARLIEDSCLGRPGSLLRGHEFHYASIELPGTDAPFALVSDAYGSEPDPPAAGADSFRAASSM